MEEQTKQLSIFDNEIDSIEKKKKVVDPCDICFHAHKRHCETCKFSCLDCRLREYFAEKNTKR